MQGIFTDLTGKSFNRLLVLERGFTKNGRIYWICKCDCGNIKPVASNKLTKNRILSCGCLAKELSSISRTIHGMAHSKNKKGHSLYHIWLRIKNRCSNPKRENYKYYGGKGITVCRRWLDTFQNFYDDMFPSWSEGLTIDRIDNKKGYSPDNCKWSTIKEQNRNKTNNHNLEYKGQIKCITDWATIYHINYTTLAKRLKRGWDIEKALNTPLDETKRRKIC